MSAEHPGLWCDRPWTGSVDAIKTHLPGKWLLTYSFLFGRREMKMAFEDSLCVGSGEGGSSALCLAHIGLLHAHGRGIFLLVVTPFFCMESG